MANGKVYLVGAGPGDPGLLTIKGQLCLTQADVVIYDYLANPLLLGYAPEHAEKIYVGKVRGNHHLPQEQTNALLAEKAAEGKQVVRLKGGDPYIFGRGGEEAAYLKERNIPFEVVPGVTAGFAAAAYAGIPLTHRDITTSLALMTGHERPERKLSSLDWEKLATGLGTLIFYMGMTNLRMISEQLIEHGRSPKTPVAVVQWATLPRQRTLVGTLETIADDVVREGIEPPAVIIVGEVVGYRENLRWYDNLPLFGKRFLITRPRAQATEFIYKLQQQGAETICIPTIEIAPPDDLQPLDDAISNISDFDSLILTSANGVEAFFARLAENKKDVRCLAGIQLIAVGPKTAETIEKHGLRPDLVPERYQAEGLVEELLAEGVEGKRFLYPRAKVVRPVLSEGLKSAGAEVVAPVAYQNVRPTGKEEMIRHLLSESELDAVCFTSSSTFENLLKMFGDELKELKGRAEFFSIGSITTETIRKNGFEVALQPEKFTIDDLVAAMVEYYQK
ncbi:uroporphyrinogen-III synthase /uroporphyrinogen-III C-methyltransferase [Malonomonas rubra DSM 5091]|uniref:uroporphyrinogen-III C-methyltransferase n=1 Tax=Malonomonas rubra DSM 5091 TaxID=1122189 RepID=A0A1M6FFJ0_MALRU|nr:uroporphyrinogen-III C-methyltransferase [Malonomonas rubra]SHI96396.1 uroporphyrinogen-III synthase /uroporphyrinogen-III C-methyltransferase [Malonomonas rubra DSM 5091]